MYFESKIVPIDESGHFLVATHFARHQIGGEITRESDSAYFAYGHIDKIDDLVDITHLCCIERSPSKEEEAYFKDKYERGSFSIGSSQATYQSNIKYQMELATKKSNFVPRQFFVSNNGLLMVLISCTDEIRSYSYAVQRTIDLFNKKTVYECFADGFPDLHKIIHMRSFSYDGKSFLNIFQKNDVQLCVEQNVYNHHIIQEYSNIVSVADFFAIKDGWVFLSDNILYKINSASTEPQIICKLPKGLLEHDFVYEQQVSLLAFSGAKGLIVTLNLLTNQIKRYYPHRGCKRDDYAEVQISQDGKWLASKLHTDQALIVTQIESGQSWKVVDIHHHVVIEAEEGKFRSTSKIDGAFAFVQGTLLSYENKKVNKIELIVPHDQNMIHVSEQGREGARKPMRLNAYSSIDQILKEARLQNSADQIKDYYYPACYLKSKKIKKKGWDMPDQVGAIALGASRLGGWPDLPENHIWPTWQQRPMSFLGQINLAEAHQAQPDLRLPKNGLLLFFIGCSEEVVEHENSDLNQKSYMMEIIFGSSEQDKNGCKVIYAKDTQNLIRQQYLADITPQLFYPCGLNFSKGGMPIPTEWSVAYSDLRLNQEEWENFNEVLDLLDPQDEQERHQLSGYPKLIQSTAPEIYCTLVSQGQDPWNQCNIEDPLLLPEACELGLLIQFHSDHHADFIWGDGGHLYFYGKRKDMELGCFDDCWVYFEN